MVRGTTSRNRFSIDEILGTPMKTDSSEDNTGRDFSIYTWTFKILKPYLLLKSIIKIILKRMHETMKMNENICDFLWENVSHEVKSN